MIWMGYNYVFSTIPISDERCLYLPKAIWGIVSQTIGVRDRITYKIKKHTWRNLISKYVIPN
jgi:hypothetical protein